MFLGTGETLYPLSTEKVLSADTTVLCIMPGMFAPSVFLSKGGPEWIFDPFYVLQKLFFILRKL